MSSTISLWNTGKKKPIFSITFAHGVESASAATVAAAEAADPKMIGMNRSAPTDIGEVPRWITSLAALRGTDLFASGTSFAPGPCLIPQLDLHKCRCRYCRSQI